MALVPVTGRRPPHAAIRFLEFTQVRATKPSAAKSSMSGHNAPKWCESRVSSTAVPLARAMPPDARGVEASVYPGSRSITATEHARRWVRRKYAAAEPIAPPPTMTTSACIAFPHAAMYGYRQSTGGTTVASIARGDTKHTSFHIEPDLVVCARGTGTAERLLADHTCCLPLP